jgi:protein ImuA
MGSVDLGGQHWGLPASIARGALNEVVAAYPDWPAAFGFMAALTAMGQRTRAGPAIMIVTRRMLMEHGAPYGHGLAQLGVAVDRLILVETETDRDALWALEETLRSEARPALVAGAIGGGLDLTSSRRLNLAAALHRSPLALLTGAREAGQEGGTSAAATRWRIASAPAARDRFGTLAGPRWHVVLERSRLGGHMNRPDAWLIEWGRDDKSHDDRSKATLRFRVVERLADRPPAEVASLSRAG